MPDPIQVCGMQVHESRTRMSSVLWFIVLIECRRARHALAMRFRWIGVRLRATSTMTPHRRAA